MHIFNRSVCTLFMFFGLCSNSPMYGMKRANGDMQEVKPPVAGDILQLPYEVLQRIIMFCPETWRNVLQDVCKLLRLLADKQHPNLLQYFDNFSLEDKQEFLAKYLATGNVTAAYNAMKSCPPQTLLWLKKRCLLDYLDAGNIAMVEAILENCPKGEFEKESTLYNNLLVLKWKQRALTHGQDSVQSLAPYCENSTSCQELEKSGQFDPNSPLQKLLANQQQDLMVLLAENKNQDNGTDAAIQVARTCTILLRYAAALNNHDMIKALLSTIPFKTHFNPLVSLKSLDDNYYPILLSEAAQYSNAAIFSDIFSWTYPMTTQPGITMSTPRINGMVVTLPANAITPVNIECILNDLISMGKDQHLQPVMWYISQGPYADVCTLYGLHSIGIEHAITEKKWSCLETILDSINTEKKISCTYDQSILYNLVLHEAKALSGPIPADYYTHKYHPAEQQRIKKDRQKLEKHIKILKRQEPALFEKLTNFSHKMYCDHTIELVNMIGSIAGFPHNMVLTALQWLEEFIGHDHTLINYIISVAQERRDACVPGTALSSMLQDDPSLLKWEQALLDNAIAWLKRHQENNPTHVEADSKVHTH